MKVKNEIKYNMLLEFCYFLGNLEDYENDSKKKEEELFTPPQFVKDLIDSTYKDLSPIMKADLKLLYKDTILVSHFIGSPDNCIKYRNYMELRKHMETISVSEYLEVFYKTYNIDTDGLSEKDAINKVEDALINLDQNETIIDSYHELKKYPKQMMNRIRDFLDRFYFEYFKKAEDTIEEFLIEKLKKHKKLLEYDRDNFINGIVTVSFDELKNEDIKYNFYLGYLNIGRISYINWGSELICSYSYLYEKRFDPQYLDQLLTGFFKALSDETRLKIIRKLAERSYYSKELADEIGINKATISYHMRKFNNFKIIDARLGKNKRVYYSLNKKNLEKAFSRFLDTLD